MNSFRLTARMLTETNLDVYVHCPKQYEIAVLNIRPELTLRHNHQQQFRKNATDE